MPLTDGLMEMSRKGLGMTAIVDPAHVTEAQQLLQASGETTFHIGEVTGGDGPAEVAWQ